MTEALARERAQEIELALCMKKNYCNLLGKETNPAKAAEILYQIGLLYRQKSPNKIALIQSAGLLNAAIVRQPSNVKQIKSDLAELCQLVLEMANAKNQNVDLIKKAEQVKTKVTELRLEVQKFLKNLPKLRNNSSKEESNNLNAEKIIAIKQINKIIAQKYKQIMAELSEFCEYVMGKPPCEYAIIGMGSLARQEITPYSDFEHVIILFDDENYKLHLVYFKWFSVIFHIIVLNVQETIVPSLNIYSLNDKNSSLGDWYYDDVTKRGISFDGMMPHACMFPLGRQQHTTNKPFTTELIKPVGEMLNYLSSDAELKHGYHVADILTKTCFVYGNPEIFKQFADCVQKYRDTQSHIDRIYDVKKQVEDDLQKFSTRFRLANLKSQLNINIKQLVYRSSTLFISALARIHNISANSCFDIINQMAKNKQITERAADKLRLAIAIACEMRLRVYTNMTSQCDNAIDLTQNGIEKFLNIVGMASTINYFQIAYCLQCEVAKQLGFTKLHFYSKPQFINITIGLAFGTGVLTNFPTDLTQNRFWKSSEFDFDACLEKLETELNLDKEIMAHQNLTFASDQSRPNNLFKSFAKTLYSAEIYDEALEFYKQLLDVYHTKFKNSNYNCDIAFINNEIGLCLSSLNQKEKALQYYKKALQIYQNANANVRFIAAIYHNIGFCHVSLKNYDEALTNLNQALKIRQSTTLNADVDEDIAESLACIGDCQVKLNNHQESLTYLNNALEIFQTVTLNADKDRKIAFTFTSIGKHHINLENYDLALANLNQALEILQNTTLHIDTDSTIAVTHHEIGRCHYLLEHYNQAIKSFNRSLEIFQNLTLNPVKDRNIAASYQLIGLCHEYMHSYAEAITNLRQALKIYKNTASNADTDKDVSITLQKIGQCHIDLHNYHQALVNLNQSLEIQQNSSANADTDKNLAMTLHIIGRCHLNLHNYNEALANLNRSLKIEQNVTTDADTDASLALTLHEIGRCHTNLHSYNEALAHLNQSLAIQKKSVLNADTDMNLAVTIGVIGRCHVDLCNYDIAMAHLTKAFEAFQNTSSNLHNKDRNSAIIQCNIGRCRIGWQQYDQAWDCFEKSLKVFQNNTSNENEDFQIANIFNYMGEYLITKQQFEEALTYLQKAHEIYQAQINACKDTRLATTNYNIGICYVELEMFSKALFHFKTSSEIYMRSPRNEYLATKIESIRLKIDECIVKQQKV